MNLVPRRVFFKTVGATMGLFRGNRKAQNIVEYALLVTILSAAVAAMSTYVFRSVQSKQKEIREEFQKD